MLNRVLETEVMDSAEEAADYDAMDHTEVNQRFVADLLATGPIAGELLDLGTGTAQIPIELCRQDPQARLLAIDLAQHMLDLAGANIHRAGLQMRIRIERVADGRYERSLCIGGVVGVIRVEPASKNRIAVTMRFPKISALPAVIARVRRVFDLAADPVAIS